MNLTKGPCGATLSLPIAASASCARATSSTTYTPVQSKLMDIFGNAANEVAAGRLIVESLVSTVVPGLREYAAQMPHEAWAPVLHLLAAPQAQLVDLDLLSIFFTEEAVEMLRALPNNYWLYRISRTAAVHHAGEGRIGRAYILEALRRERSDMKVNVDDIDKLYEKLTKEEALLRLSLGILLIRCEEGGGITPVMNPVFQDQHTHPLVQQKG